jgi:hypothetical protein
MNVPLTTESLPTTYVPIETLLGMTLGIDDGFKARQLSPGSPTGLLIAVDDSVTTLGSETSITFRFDKAYLRDRPQKITIIRGSHRKTLAQPRHRSLNTRISICSSSLGPPQSNRRYAPLLARSIRALVHGVRGRPGTELRRRSNF